MKDKKEILYHLSNVPYNKIAAHKIIGFLLGKDIVEKGEKVNFSEAKEGERLHTFNDFYEWYNVVNGNEVLTTLLVDLGDKLACAIDKEMWEVANRVSLQIELLIDTFGLDEEEGKKGE